MKTAVFGGRVRVLSETGEWIYFYSFINFFSIKGSATLSSAVCYQGQIITGGEKATPRALRRKASLKWTIILIEQEAQYLGKCTSCRNRLHCVLHYASTDRKKNDNFLFQAGQNRKKLLASRAVIVFQFRVCPGTQTTSCSRSVTLPCSLPEPRP